MDNEGEENDDNANNISLINESETNNTLQGKNSKLDKLRQKEINLLEKVNKISNFENEMARDKELAKEFTRQCIVTFKNIEVKNQFWNDWKNSRIYHCLIKLPFCSSSNAPKIGNSIVFLTEAPETTDLIWKNLGISGFRKQLVRLLGFFLNTCFLLLSILLLGGLKIYKSIRSKRKIDDKVQIFGMDLMDLSTGIIINIINFVFRKLIMCISKSSKYSTKTKFIESYLQLIVIFQFVNSTLIVLILGRF